MGCYNFFDGICPKCGKVFCVQTKLTGDNFEHHKVGDNLGLEGRIEVKEPCECGLYPVAVFDNGVLLRYEEGNPTEREGLFGEILWPKETRKEQFEKLFKLDGDI